MEQHPLYRSLALGIPLRDRLKILVRHRAGESINRRDYRPEAVAGEPQARGERIVLIEDLWVSGGAGVATGSVGVVERRQIHLGDRRLHEPGKVTFRQPLAHVRWHQKRLLMIGFDEVLGHA